MHGYSGDVNSKMSEDNLPYISIASEGRLSYAIELRM